MEAPANIAAAVVLVLWIVWLGVFFARGRKTPGPERARSRSASIGIGLQGAAFFLLFVGPEAPFARFARHGAALALAAELTAVALAIGSVVVAIASVRALGRQWAVAARIVEGHRLVREGPYRYVRHPIYTTMLGMLLSAGIAITPAIQLAASVILFFVGFVIRTTAEEKLLAEAFGPEFDRYRREVPAILPKLWGR